MKASMDPKIAYIYLLIIISHLIVTATNSLHFPLVLRYTSSALDMLLPELTLLRTLPRATNLSLVAAS